jgi:uncharacterized protein DUF4175
MQADLALRAALARIRRRWALVAGLRTANLGAALVAVIFALAVLFDRIVHPEGAALLAVPAAVAAIAAAVGVVVVLRSPRLPDDRQVARFIEERAAALGHALDDALVSAVAALEGTSPFRGALVDRAVRRLGQLDLDGVVPSSALRRSGFAALGSGAALAVAMALAVPGAERAIESARVRFFPGTVRLEVTPGNVRIKEGSPLRIRASLRGTNDSVRHVVPRLILTANGQRRDLSMSPTRGEYEYTLKTIDRSFTYQVTAETVQSPTYSVTALSPPRVTRIDVHYRYPAFTGLAPRDEQDGGDIYAPAGTRVRLSIYTDKPIAQGDLRLGGASTVPLAGSDDCKAEAEILLSKDDSYRIRLSDADGLESNGEPEYFIRLMDDRPPDVRILRPSADQPITPLEEVPIEARADDDYGIASFDLVYAVAGGSEHVVPFERVTGTNEQKVGTRLLPAEDLHVKPGDVITYYARARDVARGKPATLATSDIFFLEVKPFSEEFVAAQSQGGGGGGGDPQIESLIEAQKQIISSTWNVERRAQAGRSADDIKAIAEAQAEAKARAEHLAARSRRPRTRGAFPQRTAPEPQASREPADDPIAEAVDAMEKALQQLGADRTKDALAHEMAALNGLLRAQAEVRRRQVTQGANGSGSGGNRSEQDLSALFDKELQRDQRTRYENRPSVETRQEDEKKDSALDRIRELARRQDDLSQRQRELAQSNVSAEERKRQLETLTREQEELRRQLEDLARRAASGSNPPASKDPGATGRAGELPGSKDPGPTGLASTGRAGSSDPAKSSADRASALRDASRHMRNAAGELGQNDPARAAESSQEAANRLKQLEGTMAAPTPAGGGRPGDGKREAEARQLSQELEQTRAIRERLQRAEQQLRDAERGQSGVRPGSDRGQTGVRPGSDRGQTPDLQRLGDAYQRELEQAQEALSRLSAGGSRGDWGATPEHHEYSRSAPGTQAFKQDRSDWESLRKNVEQSLERYEANISDRLMRARTDDRFSGGGSEQVPEAYRQIIAKYFESLARRQR